MIGSCALCERETEVTRHHLVPQCRHGKTARRRWSRAELKRGLILPLCRPCHSQVHAVLTERELERHYHAPAALRAHPALAKFAAWMRTKPPGFRAVVRPSRQKGLARWK